MKRHVFVFAFALAMSVFANIAQAQPPAPSPAPAFKLEEDFDKVLAEAKKDGKFIMLEFSGLDWCPPCKMLHKYIVKTDEFEAYAAKNLHVIIADFGRDGEPKNAAQAASYKELADKYQIEGFPTVVIISPDGKVVDKMVGLGVKTPKEFIAWIEAAKKK